MDSRWYDERRNKEESYMSVMEERFEELERRLAESDQAGGPEKISKQHQAGKMTARAGPGTSGQRLL